MQVAHHVPMTDPQSEQRQKWRRYFEQIITGPNGEVEAATDGAMEAIARRSDQAAVIAAGRAAAAEYRANGGRRKPPPPPAPQAQVPIAAHRPAGNPATGVVTGLQQRQEMSGRTYFQVWNFRLVRPGRTDLPPVPVEMRARSFRGQLANGDTVELPSSRRPMQLKNLTTGATIKGRGKPHPIWSGVAITIFMIIFVIVAIFIVSNILQIASLR